MKRYVLSSFSDNDRPLVVDVKPWNSVRVTLKVSRETASALQRLAQRRDQKLIDIGILSVQVDGGSVLHLGRDNGGVATTAAGLRADSNLPTNSDVSKLFRNRHDTDDLTVTVSDAGHLGTAPSSSSQHSLVNRTAVISNAVASLSSTVTNASGGAWHPLEERQKSVSVAGTKDGSSSSCFWNQMSTDWRQNGLTSDPFQFSADDLLTRMLADVPSASNKRKQRVRKASSSAAGDVTKFEKCSLPAQSTASATMNPHFNADRRPQPARILCNTNTVINDRQMLNEQPPVSSGNLVPCNPYKNFPFAFEHAPFPDNEAVRNVAWTTQPAKRRRTGQKLKKTNEAKNVYAICEQKATYAQPPQHLDMCGMQGMQMSPFPVQSSALQKQFAPSNVNGLQYPSSLHPLAGYPAPHCRNSQTGAALGYGPRLLTADNMPYTETVTLSSCSNVKSQMCPSNTGTLCFVC